MGCSWSDFAFKTGIHSRTLNDWRREEHTIPLWVFNKLSTKIDKEFKKDIEIKDPFWYASKGSKIGWKAVLEKYGHVGGDPEYRKQKWREWWEREGKYKESVIGIAKSIKIPRFSKKLAEFTGIVMGDGSLTKYQLQLCFHKKDDKLYAEFVKNLIENIFKVPVSICYLKDEMAMKLVVSRKKLVEFCNTELMLPIGDKLRNRLDVSDWIKNNIEFQKACMRGLIDTDGCIFNEVHNIKGKKYSYKRLNFTSASLPLRRSVFLLFEQLGFLPKMRNDRSVQIEKKEKIERYFKVIGTNNPKHARRFTEEYR